MRRTNVVKITAEGRDKGKHFLLTEMYSDDGERWAMRALLGLISAGVELPDDYATLGMAGLAQQGLRGLTNLKWETLEPLMLEMFQCYQIIADPKNAAATTRELVRDDIEEIPTRLTLRVEWGKMHLDFFESAVPSLIRQAKTALGKSMGIKTSQK